MSPMGQGVDGFWAAEPGPIWCGNTTNSPGTEAPVFGTLPDPAQGYLVTGLFICMLISFVIHWSHGKKTDDFLSLGAILVN